MPTQWVAMAERLTGSLADFGHSISKCQIEGSKEYCRTMAAIGFFAAYAANVKDSSFDSNLGLQPTMILRVAWQCVCEFRRGTGARTEIKRVRAV